MSTGTAAVTTGAVGTTARVVTRQMSAPPVVQTGAGIILGLLAWGWVIMPFIQGGPSAVSAVLRAKFLNKDAKGEWLP